ncbi:DUF397 domain-containing protein [Streptomyces acidiscabies]|uniref:DUF397 domain-containing protein n=1 Tax=Streptomyces acidiscabies TaxID=42234 RepID=UPI0009520B7A|nr:DUF397 domain-containing protein [Streptomyces acidiscabies]
MKHNTSEYAPNSAAWCKTSDSGDRLEVARWRKSTYSAGDGGDCLEVADGHPHLTPVRDSKNPSGPALVFRTQSWTAFVEDLKQL